MIAVSTLIVALGGCVNSPRNDDREGLGSVDGAYYDRPRDYEYDYYPAAVTGGYYYQRGYPGYYDHGRDRDNDWHGRGDHDDGHGRGDHSDRDHGPAPRSPIPVQDLPAKPTYNDMRAGKLNPHIGENAGGNRMTRGAGGKR